MKGEHEGLWPPVEAASGDDFRNEFWLSDGLTGVQEAQLMEWFREHRKAFSFDRDRLGHCTLIRHRIDKGAH